MCYYVGIRKVMRMGNHLWQNIKAKQARLQGQNSAFSGSCFMTTNYPTGLFAFHVQFCVCQVSTTSLPFLRSLEVCSCAVHAQLFYISKNTHACEKKQETKRHKYKWHMTIWYLNTEEIWCTEFWSSLVGKRHANSRYKQKSSVDTNTDGPTVWEMWLCWVPECFHLETGID